MDLQPNKLSLGTRVSLITSAQYRYEGTVAAINSIEGTLTLQNVRFWGTENRIPPPGAAPNAEAKTPAVGSIFDSITFWMSSVVQLRSAEDNTLEQNDLGDQAVVKAAVGSDTSRSRGRRPKGWWSTSGDQSRQMRPSPTDNIAAMHNGATLQASRYYNPPPQQIAAPQPRMLVSYPRRGRTANMMLPPQTNYVPVVPLTADPNGPRRSGFPQGLRSAPFRLLTTPPLSVPPGRVGAGGRGGRKPGQIIRRVNGGGDGRRYVSGGMNPRGGVFVYLPPEVAASYHPRALNFMPPRGGGSRRRLTDRRGTPRGPGSAENEIDCSTPYDFESANAELEAELAKINLNTDGGVTSSVNTSTGSTPATSTNTAIPTASTGDGLSSVGLRLQPSGTQNVAAVAGGNGASGDSSLGAVTSTISSNAVEATSSTSPMASENGPLAKGEFYVREKCFFDQISRSEGGPRGPSGAISVNRGVVGFHPSSSGTYGTGVGGQNGNVTAGGGAASAAARRERQLNMETFGPMAARATFAPRRRPTGSVPRDLLVSASA